MLFNSTDAHIAHKLYTPWSVFVSLFSSTNLALPTLHAFFFSVKTKEGNANPKGQNCVFPWLYGGKNQTQCMYYSWGRYYWCGVTANYDKDKLWGKCLPAGKWFIE